MEEAAPKRGHRQLSGPPKIAPIDPNPPETARGSEALLAWTVQRHAEGLFLLLLSQGRGAMHERQLLRRGGTHGQRAPVLQPRFSGADRKDVQNAIIRDYDIRGMPFKKRPYIFVDFDLINRIVGVSPYHLQARISTAVLQPRA